MEHKKTELELIIEGIDKHTNEINEKAIAKLYSDILKSAREEEREIIFSHFQVSSYVFKTVVSDLNKKEIDTYKYVEKKLRERIDHNDFELILLFLNNNNFEHQFHIYKYALDSNKYKIIKIMIINGFFDDPENNNNNEVLHGFNILDYAIICNKQKAIEEMLMVFDQEIIELYKENSKRKQELMTYLSKSNIN